jgi:chromosome segregation ATPase
MSKGLKAIEDVKKKFQQLAEINKKLSSKADELELKVSRLEENISKSTTEINEIKEKYKVLKMTKKLKGTETENSKELKLKINEMVKEIDKCIALLNK